jgi:hypothetical protein
MERITTARNATVHVELAAHYAESQAHALRKRFMLVTRAFVDTAHKTSELPAWACGLEASAILGRYG